MPLLFYFHFKIICAILTSGSVILKHWRYSMDKQPCLPVKITAKKWADKLQDGSVFMRSLHDFGSWSAIKRHNSGNGQMKDGVQGDIGEGIVRRVDPKVGDEFFNSFDPELRSVMKDMFYIEENIFQFCKIYCMYGLTYLIDERRFEQPDERLREFGDSAVIIYDPNEFLNRVLHALYNKYGDNCNFKLDEVHYYPPDYYGELDEFCKHVSYAWQNEMRMRVALLDENETITDADGRVRKHLIQDISPITLDIGSIRDISVQISVDDLISLRLPDIIKPPVED